MHICVDVHIMWVQLLTLKYGSLDTFSSLLLDSLRVSSKSKEKNNTQVSSILVIFIVILFSISLTSVILRSNNGAIFAQIY